MDETRFTKPITDTESRFTEWSAGETSERSIGDNASAVFLQSQGFHLHLRSKKVTQSNRTTIPATKSERLSFFRAYVSSPNRKQILVMQDARFNKFLWKYVFNLLMKAFPHTFVHLFLASYAPDEHIFLPKMVPIVQGCKYSFVLAGFFEILTFVDTLTMMMFFTVSSIFYMNPWNRCTNESFFEPVRNISIECYEMEDFTNMFLNNTPQFDRVAYNTTEDNHFQLSQLLYYRRHRRSFVRDLSYFTMIWIVAGLSHTRVFTRSFWMVLHRFHWIVNGIDVVCLLFLTGVYFTMLLENRKAVEVPIFPLAEALWTTNIDMLVECISTPPSVHVLTSRSTQPIRPSEDSAMIIASNAICFILRGLLLSRVKIYCESKINAPLFFGESNRYSWFYIYTIFFSLFEYGELFTMGFFAIYFVTELTMLIVIYHCFIEAVINEWKCMKRWCLVSIVTVAGISTFCLCKPMTRYLLFIYGTGISTLFEVLFLYLLYPLDRLIDDYSFHYGEQLTTLRILTLRGVPLYYSGKFYLLLSGLLKVIMTKFSFLFPASSKWSWSIIVAPVLFGVLMVLYRYILVERKDWRLMFRPVPHWGPKDFQARQLRKQFDSRNYIGSQYPRLLSRYLLRKAEAESYKLELRYEVPRSSAPKGQEDQIRFFSEKRA